MKKGFMGMWQS